jgi:hypothetical protein
MDVLVQNGCPVIQIVEKIKGKARKEKEKPVV